MMRMKAHLGASWAFAAFHAHFKRSFTANAEFEFTLCACKMHAATFGKSISKFTARTCDSMFL